MKAIIQKKKILSEVHSASGLEIVNDHIYIIGDDSPYLFKYNSELILEEKILLFTPASVSAERIPKISKPDLETLTFLSYRGKDYLLTLGSGSKKETRDKGFLVELRSLQVIALSLNSLYTRLESDKSVVGAGRLNIEGLCATTKETILLVRGNVSGLNITLRYNLDEFLTHLLTGGEIGAPSINSYQLPAMEGWLSGFSGAAYNPNKDNILFTATVEKTTNEIDDGETLGSFVGEIPVASSSSELNYSLIMENDSIYKGKVESISIVESDETITALAVTDSDGGDSELLWLEISF